MKSCIGIGLETGQSFAQREGWSYLLGLIAEGIHGINLVVELLRFLRVLPMVNPYRAGYAEKLARRPARGVLAQSLASPIEPDVLAGAHVQNHPAPFLDHVQGNRHAGRGFVLPGPAQGLGVGDGEGDVQEIHRFPDAVSLLDFLSAGFHVVDNGREKAFVQGDDESATGIGGGGQKAISVEHGHVMYLLD